MVRTYHKKTQRAFIDEEAIKAAITDVIKHHKSIRVAAADNNLKAATLQHRIEKYRKNHRNINSEVSDDSALEDDAADLNQVRKYHSKYTSTQVFSVEEECELEKYLVKSSRMHYGLTYRQARELAYQYAKHLPNCSVPESWELNKIAGKFWMQSFMKRHSSLRLRSPENTSLARATAFNRTTVNEFFDNYMTVMESYKFSPDRIYNIDETGITTVLSTPRVIAESGKINKLLFYIRQS